MFQLLQFWMISRDILRKHLMEEENLINNDDVRWDHGLLVQKALDDLIYNIEGLIKC